MTNDRTANDAKLGCVNHVTCINNSVTMISLRVLIFVLLYLINSASDYEKAKFKYSCTDDVYYIIFCPRKGKI